MSYFLPFAVFFWNRENYWVETRGTICKLLVTKGSQIACALSCGDWLVQFLFQNGRGIKNGRLVLIAAHHTVTIRYNLSFFECSAKIWRCAVKQNVSSGRLFHRPLNQTDGNQSVWKQNLFHRATVACSGSYNYSFFLWELNYYSLLVIGGFGG